MYNENILEYTYISLYNNSFFGKEIDDDLYGYLIRECVKILIVISNKLLNQKKLINLITRLIQRNFNEAYVFSKRPFVATLINIKTEFDIEFEGGSYYKYIKYKEKYLQLKKSLNL
jgi:hypothetical protein